MPERQHAWSTMILPSQGEFYVKDGQKLLPEGRVQLRRMEYEEENLLNAPGTDHVDRISAITSNCLKLPDPKALKPEDLLMTDRVALLLWLRLLTYGPKFKFTWRCPGCRVTSRKEVDIVQDFDATTAEKVRAKLGEKEPPETLEEPWTLRLPDCGKTVRLRFLRGHDEQDVFKRAKRARMSSTDATDPSRAYRVAKQIVAVDGVPPESMLAAEQFVRLTMSAKDRAAVRISTDERETGVDTRVSTVCRACGYEALTAVEFDYDFFQPSAV